MSQQDWPSAPGLPQKQGLYDPANERDNCGLGFIADIKNRKSHDIVRDGLQILINLDHRGAIGADPLAGDGAGILLQVPDRLFQEECPKLGFDLPPAGDYAVGMVFLPTNKKTLDKCIVAFDKVVPEEGQSIIGWRDVPVDNSVLGESVK
ncbi:MAG: class II glutamine amidotransferase, partial [Rhodospirillaceae bacterium]|nr:class II glutamine amidotransferase [Rhodospirillaceae bacterium]